MFAHINVSQISEFSEMGRKGTGRQSGNCLSLVFEQILSKPTFVIFDPESSSRTKDVTIVKKLHS